MKTVLISGLSGAGKTTALKCLEDEGYCCTDNLPPELLPILTDYRRRSGIKQSAVCCDIRSLPAADTGSLKALSAPALPDNILFLEADDSELQRRFAETRRIHPLDKGSGLADALARERKLMNPLRNAARIIDTTRLSPTELRRQIRSLLDIGRHTALLIESFDYKYGLPAGADFIFDVRSLPNPHYLPELRPQTGLDPAVARYLEQQPETAALLADLETFLIRAMQRMQQAGRSRIAAAVGCTGGQHRSVYIAETLGRRLAEHFTVSVRHSRSIKPKAA